MPRTAPFLLVSLFYFSLFDLSGNGCTYLLREDAAPADRESDRELIKAVEYHFKKGDTRRCKFILSRFLKEYRKSPFLGRALFLSAEIAFFEKRYRDALDLYKKVLRKGGQGVERSEIYQRLVFIFREMEDYTGLSRYLNKMAKGEKRPLERAGLLENLGDSYIAMKRGLDAMIEYGKAYHLLKIHRKDTLRLEEKVEEGLALIGYEDLKGVERVFGNSFPVPIIIYELAERAMKGGDTERSRELALSFEERDFEDRWKMKGGYLLRRIEMERVNRERVGLLLPLSGNFSSIGERIRNGIDLALEIRKGEGWNVPEIAVRDTEGSREGVKELLEELSFGEKVIGVIGPVLQSTVESAGEIAQAMGLPLIALTQREDIHPHRDFVFRNFISSAEQTSFLARTLLEKMGYRRFALLIPDTPYGFTTANLFWNQVLKGGGLVTSAEVYNPSEVDIREPVQKMVLSFYEEPRRAELQRLKREILTDGNPFNDKDRVILPPIIDFEVIFIPDNARNSATIAHNIAYAGVPVGSFLASKGRVVLAGLSSWNSKEMIERGKNLVEGSIFVDAYFPGDEKETNRKFVERYRERYEGVPDLFSAIGFDTINLILYARGKDGSLVQTREDLKERLKMLRDPGGVTGMKGMDEEGNMDRELNILTLKEGGTVRWEEGHPVEGGEGEEPPGVIEGNEEEEG